MRAASTWEANCCARVLATSRRKSHQPPNQTTCAPAWFANGDEAAQGKVRDSGLRRMRWGEQSRDLKPQLRCVVLVQLCGCGQGFCPAGPRTVRGVRSGWHAQGGVANREWCWGWVWLALRRGYQPPRKKAVNLARVSALGQFRGAGKQHAWKEKPKLPSTRGVF